MKNDLDWEAVKAAGHQLGLHPRAIESWRERRAVPFKWWLEIERVTKGKITAYALDAARKTGSK
jgi:DNA-binding transcriptional regulator YdaS (Cro superfamily)